MEGEEKRRGEQRLRGSGGKVTGKYRSVIAGVDYDIVEVDPRGQWVGVQNRRCNGKVSYVQ